MSQVHAMLTLELAPVLAHIPW